MIKPYLTLKYSKSDGKLVQRETTACLQDETPAFITKTTLSEYFDARPTDTFEDVIAHRALGNPQVPNTPQPSSGLPAPNFVKE